MPNSLRHTIRPAGLGQRLLDLTERVGESHFLIAVQRSLALTLPLIMMGAIALLLRNFPIESFIEGQSPAFAAFCDVLIKSTFGVASLAILLGFSITLTRYHVSRHGQRYSNPAVTCIVVLCCFFVAIEVSPGNTLENALSIERGLFTALLIAAVAGKLFLVLSGLSFLRPPLGALGTDPLIGDVFLLTPAAISTILIFTAGAFLFASFVCPTFTMLLSQVLSYIPAPSAAGLGFALVYEFLCQLLWLTGLHGPNFLYAINDRLLWPASEANTILALQGFDPQFLITSQFSAFFVRLGGSGSTLCLIAAILWKGRLSDNRKLALLALVPGLFNVNEPLLFGIPLVLNPLFAVPFLLVPAVQTVITFAAMSFEWLPKTSGSTVWTTPILISGYMTTGSIAGTVAQIVLLAVGTLIYAPFVVFSEQIARRRSGKLLNDLMDLSQKKETEALQKRYLLHAGPEGRVAIALAHDLDKALDRGAGLYLDYQPQVDVLRSEMTGAEALLRWQHPVYGQIAPPLIVGIAEEIGRLDDLGFFVLNKASKQRHLWSPFLPDTFTISVNVAPPQLAHPSFGQNVLQILAAHGLKLSQIELEITETAAILPNHQSVDMLKDLNQAGLRVALDDFGMGHTSIHYLRELPLSKIKIDRSLTTSVENHANELIVKSILDIGRSLDIQILVEGIEDEEQLERFMSMGCFNYQGYLFSKPLSITAFPHFAQSLQEGGSLKPQHSINRYRPPTATEPNAASGNDGFEEV